MSRFPRRSFATLFALASALAGACVPSYTFPSADAEAPRDVADALPDATRDGSTTKDGGGDADAADTGSDATEASAPLAPRTIVLGRDGNAGAICALKGGSLYCWGDIGSNRYGELGFPLDADAGAFKRPRLSGTRATPDQFDVGEDHSCFLYPADASARVTCRGRNESSEIGNIAAPPSGPNEFDVTNLPAGGVNVFATTGHTACAITSKDTSGGNVWCWGYLGDGALGRPLTDSHPSDNAWPVILSDDAGGIHDGVTVAGGLFHVCALTSQKKILCWGATGAYQSGPDQGVRGCNTAEMCSGKPQEVVIPGQEPVQLALGYLHSCALVKSGKVYCWGGNGNNELGVGAVVLPKTCLDHSLSFPCTDTPMAVVGLTDVVAITAGQDHTCAHHLDRHVSCWGTNNEGELGTGNRNPQKTPVSVKDIVTTQPMLFDEVAAGGFKSCGRVGTDVYCWGAGELGTTALDGSVADRNWPAPVVW